MVKITIYTTPTCGFCKLIKAYFKENSIKYEEKDVTADQTAQKQMIDKSGQMGVPVIDIDGAIVIGFDREKLKALLGLKN